RRRRGDDRLPDLVGVMLDPARPRKVLRQLRVAAAEHAQVLVDDQAGRAGRSLVDRQDAHVRLSSATPPATSPAPARRVGLTCSRRTTPAKIAVRTTLVSRTAATDAAEARCSAASTSAYAPKVASPATTVAGPKAARSAAGPL